VYNSSGTLIQTISEIGCGCFFIPTGNSISIPASGAKGFPIAVQPGNVYTLVLTQFLS